MVIPQRKRSTAKVDERARKIDEAIRLTYDSLQSHLRYTYEEPDMTSRNETKAFHKRCVTDYGKVIKILTELY